MRILFFSHYFPPEVNAPASRTLENCKRWVRAGHEVTVVTCAPNCPDGVVYEGYKNRLRQSETIDGIHVVRVWSYVAANKGTLRRIVNFLSYLCSAIVFSLFMKRPDLIIATSPQFFCGWAGLIASRLKRVPWILEIRDLWPDSIVAVGALQGSRLLTILKYLEKRMYAAATHIVTVGDGYKRELIAKGVPQEKLSVVTNGADLELFRPQLPDRELKDSLGLKGKFVCAYIGTLGLGSGLDVVLRAAEILKKRNNAPVAFLMVGDGAIREELQRAATSRGLDNVVFTGRQEKRLMPRFFSLADVCLVHLIKRDLFKTVLPSKIFEAAAMRKSIILGVEGSAAELVNKAGAGICIEPENAEQLVSAVERLQRDALLRKALSTSGYNYVVEHFDRDRLAMDYLQVLEETLAGRRRPASRDEEPETPARAA